MTVSSATNRKEYAGNGATTAFATSPVVFFATTDLDVYVVVDATGVATLKTLTTHYTLQDLAGGAYALGDTGLQVHFVSAPGVGDAIEISYSFYFPMIFEDDDALDAFATRATSGSDETTATFFADALRLRQDFPGSERRTVPVV